MAESVDATDLKSVDRKVIPVRVRARAPISWDGIGSRGDETSGIKTTFVPEGIYRFRSHDAANRHAEDCLVRGMGRLAATRLKNG